MKKTKEEQTLPIAELLPEGLSEAAINDVAELVNNVDELKDQAVRELHEEDETIRNASLFESVKTLMALELKKDDEDNVISDLVQEQREVEGEVDILMEELRKSFEETEKLETSLKALGKKVGKLEGDRAKLLEAVSVLEESKEKPFKSSEKAVIISEDVDNKKITKSNPRAFNDFLTPEVMKFMPSDKS